MNLTDMRKKELAKQVNGFRMAAGSRKLRSNGVIRISRSELNYVYKTDIFILPHDARGGA